MDIATIGKEFEHCGLVSIDTRILSTSGHLSRERNACLRIDKGLQICYAGKAPTGAHIPIAAGWRGRDGSIHGGMVGGKAMEDKLRESTTGWSLHVRR